MIQKIISGGQTGADRFRCFILILIVALINGCAGISAKEIQQPTSKTGIANPASVNCINKGGSLSIQKGADGGEYGICTFKDGQQCEEWAFFRGECPAGKKKDAGISAEKPSLAPVKSIGNLHMHTTCSDGKNSYEEMVQQAIHLNFDFISITDHKFGGSPLCDAVIEQCKAEKRLLCIPGMEVTGKVHLLAIGIHNSIDKRLPVKKQVEEVHKQGGLAIAAHPFRKGNTYTDNELFESGLDAVECKGILTDWKDEFYTKLQDHDMPCVYNSDAHRAVALMTNWTVCDGEIKSLDDLKVAIKEKKCGR